MIASLAAKGMVEEDGAGALVVTATAFAALGLEVPGTKAVRKARVGTKQEALIALLRRPEGASIAEIMEAANWQAHYADSRIMPMSVRNLLFLGETAAKGSA
ncbi:DUF3489 domain-containing protein [Paramagnetospirillum caucaseum]|uniref:DUF3489 domain-containing protein n=1 Tax=Paramagnetospirillum caucaseum TaxID=1244869 RepID=UPI00034B0CAE|nr:DUF3489 domain-containing protein [Paramagnetospirillum caucaseum]